VRPEVLKLVAAGLNDCQICPLRGEPSKPIRIVADDYGELLGLYLGDGHIAQTGRADRLRISLDSMHPMIVMKTMDLLRRVFPANKVGVVWAKEGAVCIPHVYSQHLRCMFPQAGPGKKHERRIALEPWQQDLVAVAPWAFLRGLIRSDGCSFINRTGKYEYLSYDFSNYSQDILDLFCEGCESVEVQYRRYPRSIRVYRRASVALMERHVGVKS
jgi:hypothetical protein